MRVAAFGPALAIVIEACSPPAARTNPDAAAPPIDGAYCGDGIVAGVPFEECDDGPLTGTAQSLCTRQCHRGNAIVPPMAGLTFPFPIASAAQVGCGSSLWAFTTPSDSDGVRFAFDVELPFSGTEAYLGALATLREHSKPTGIGGLDFLEGNANLLCDSSIAPLWVEKRVEGIGGPWLLYATFDANRTPQIRELPYPFPDGQGGELITVPGSSAPGPFQILVDQSTGPSPDLLVAVIVPRSMSDVGVFTARIPCPSSPRGSLSRDSLLDDVIDRAQSPNKRPLRLVQFFRDSSEFVTIEIRIPINDVYAQLPGTSYQITEFGRGDWPFPVVQAVPWIERASNNAEVPSNLAALTHPQPRAVLTNTGDIYMWQFDRSYVPGQETFLTPFAHVSPSALLFSMLPSVIEATEPDGHRQLFVDSDEERLQSGTLRPQSAPDAPAWSASTNPDSHVAWYNRHLLVLDNGLYH